MRVVQGVLPENGAAIDPSTFLEAWIASTQVFELGPEAFKGSLQFILSQTDPPSMAQRQYSTLWFKRGEGRLYVWDYNDQPLGPTETGLNADRLNWLSISDRRDIWGQAVEAMPAGTPFYYAYSTNASGFGYNLVTSTGVSLGWDGDQSRILWNLSAMCGPNGTTGLHDAMAQGVMFVALETTVSGGRARFCEHGFCSVYMASGESNVAGPLRVDCQASQTQWFKLHPAGYTIPSVNNTAVKWAYYGYAQGAGVAGPGTRTAWKPLQASWHPTGGAW
jgi:hypothetical protein